MIISIENLVLLLLCVAFLSIFILGFLVGKSISGSSVVYSEKYSTNKNKSSIKPEIVEQLQKIQIDDSKFVNNIDVSDMEKKYDNIADSVEKQEEIDQSINKLSSLIKGK